MFSVSVSEICALWLSITHIRSGTAAVFSLKERPERNFFSCCSNPLGHQEARTPEKIPNLMVQTRFGLDDREQHWTGKTDVQVQWKSSLALYGDCVGQGGGAIK